MISFIHIGKCGGTTMHHLLNKKLKNYKQYHCHKNYTTNEKYIIWIRNPLSRFVSAFKFQKECIDFDVNKYKGKQLTLQNCIAPERIKSKIKTGYTFNEDYDRLITFFKSPNTLAEGLSSTNPVIKRKATRLMNYPIEHISKGIGWYLNNGKFVKNKNSKIVFVGKLETMSDDILKLQNKLNITLDTTKHLRKNNKGDTYLSELAIENLLEWYKNTDYTALNELYLYGWITEDDLQSYYTYENKN
jgi:hypothetical protein